MYKRVVGGFLNNSSDEERAAPPSQVVCARQTGRAESAFADYRRATPPYGRAQLSDDSRTTASAKGANFK